VADYYGFYERHCTDVFPGKDVNLREPVCKWTGDRFDNGSLGWYMWNPKLKRHQQITLRMMRREWGWEVKEMQEFVSMFETCFYIPQKAR
jgi:hypothetical protein